MTPVFLSEGFSLGETVGHSELCAGHLSDFHIQLLSYGVPHHFWDTCSFPTLKQSLRK